jgi:hypothetical protein
MELKDLVEQVDGFDKLPPREKIQLFAWFLHTQKKVEHFDYDAIRFCYRELHIVPDEIGKYVTRMTAVSPPDLARERSGFKLMRNVRTQLDARYGVHDSVVQVSKLLANLPGKVSDVAKRNFLTEAIKCYRHEAYRACIVMTWNLAFDHLLRWILKHPQRLADFNQATPKRYPNKRPAVVISRQSDFEDLTEREVIEICNTASLMSGSIIKILREKLDKRNTSAHPSPVVVVQSQADDVVTDLVNNVVLALI